MKDKLFAACTGIVCCYCAKEFNNSVWCKNCTITFLRKKVNYREARLDSLKEDLKLVKKFSLWKECE